MHGRNIRVVVRHASVSHLLRHATIKLLLWRLLLLPLLRHRRRRRRWLLWWSSIKATKIPRRNCIRGHRRWLIALWYRRWSIFWRSGCCVLSYHRLRIVHRCNLSGRSCKPCVRFQPLCSCSASGFRECSFRLCPMTFPWGILFKGILDNDLPVCQILTIHRFNGSVASFEAVEFHESIPSTVSCFYISSYLLRQKQVRKEEKLILVYRFNNVNVTSYPTYLWGFYDTPKRTKRVI